MKMRDAMFSWGFIFISSITLLVAMVLLSGCATYLTTSVGDHTVRTGFHLTHEVKDDD